MAQTYEPVDGFNKALERSGITPNQFTEMTGIGASAIYEWNRPRSRLAPKWAVAFADFLAQMKEITGHVPMQSTTKWLDKEVDDWLMAPAVKGTHENRTVYRFPSMRNTMLDEVFFRWKDDPTWQMMSPNQKIAYVETGQSMPFKEFYEQTKTSVAVRSGLQEVVEQPATPAFDPSKPLEL